MTKEAAQRLEIELLFEALYRCYGYDFRSYSFESASRRVLRRVGMDGLGSISELQHQILYNENAADRLLQDLSINVTEIFRDPLFYLTLRQQVLPLLDEYEHLKIWHAGCATGEEVYSMAIMLSEEGYFPRSNLYATDFNNVALDKAKSGIFPLEQMRLYSKNYQAAGGKRSFADYYHANYNSAVMKGSLKERTLFANHNLATDSSFGEMQMIVCRNVLIYFDKKLQDRVFNLFADSLCEGGILCLGSHETIKLSTLSRRFETISGDQRIYRKKW
ncbi:MAG: protein-glutamate O-methyltransferase CheR [Magnetococcales bacterium]|nr:protein-glutamate O-methyltransferase CheR [Magnetococcales bacterium]